MVLRLLSFLNAKEKFLVIELSDHYRKATALGLDNEKNIVVRKVHYQTNVQAPLQDFFRSLSFPKGSEVIVGLDAQRAVTIPASVVIVRDDAKEEIREEELQNLVAQAVWRALNRYRPHAAERLKISEPEIVLAGLRLLGAKVDGHRVINPIGFRARRIEFDIEQTFISRGLATEIKELFPPHLLRTFYIESGASLARLILKTAPEEQFLIADTKKRASELYRVQKSTRYMGSVSLPQVEYIGNVQWGNMNICEPVAERLNIESGVARQVMRVLVRGGASHGAERYLQKMFADALDELANSVHSKLRGKEALYWNSYDYVLSEAVPKKESANIKGVDCAAVLDRLGFKARASESVGEKWHSAIPPFLDYYYFKEDSWLNKLANQRAHWLIT